MAADAGQGPGRPGITEDQRHMAVTMLANALRKDAHLRERAHHARSTGDPLLGAVGRRRSESSQRYIDGMVDLLRVLFINGDAVVRDCLEEAYVMAMGTASQPGGAPGGPPSA